MGVIETSTRRPVTVFMFTLALLVFGMVLLNKLGVSLLPDLSYPTLTIRTEYEGAAPIEVENLITKPIEETIGVVKNVRKISSVSRAGQSDVLLEFNWGTDMGFAGLDVREKLDILQLPLDVKNPVLLRFNPSLDPIMRLSLSPKTKADEASSEFNEQSLIQLRRFGEEEIKKSLESLEGVAAVKISGGLEDEIQVMVDHKKMAQLNLSIQQISAKLRSENVNLSGGRLEEGNQQFLVRTVNQYQSVDEIANSIISNYQNRPIYLKDIADVSQGWKERQSITRVKGIEAVEIAIYKEGDANTVAVAEEVQKRLVRLRKLVGDEMELTQLYDQSKFISQAISEVLWNAAIGGILAMLVLYLFLKDIRATTIISLSIPISVIISFNFMFAWDISLNIMSLGGIALAVGLLVDNAIVVLENIARKKEQGLELLKASQQGTQEVAGAITAATLTTVAVFAPLVFIDGVAGQLFGDQALTVTFALLISLVVALTLIPMLSSLGARRKVVLGDDPIIMPTKAAVDKAELSTAKSILLKIWWPFKMFFTGIGWVLKHFFRILNIIIEYLMAFIMLIVGGISWLMGKLMIPLVWLFNVFYDALARIYESLLAHALQQRAIVIILALGAFAGSLSLIPRLGLELIPQMSQGEFNIEFRAEPGTPLNNTDIIINDAQAIAATIPAIERTYSVSGSGNRLDASPEKAGENWGQLSVVLKKPVTTESEEAALVELREKLGVIPGVQLKFSRPTLFTFKTPLEIEIEGYNLATLKEVSQMITRSMSASDRFADIKSTVEAGYPEVQITFDHERAARLGLSVPDIAQTVVKQIRGDIATKYSFRDRKIDVLVRVTEDDRTSVDKIAALIINPASERPINLSAIADVSLGIGPSEINRVSQERVAIISANLNYGALDEAAQEAQAIVDRVPLPQGIEIRVAGQNEEMEQSFTSMQYALALAVFLVYLVMASIFESLLHPFVILFSIPLALIGAVLGLFITGSTISVVVFIGLIMLAGIVVNNAIVLIDLINQLRTDGMARMAAIQEAGRSRLRPIVMTTLTTTFGMLPLAMGLGEGAEVRAPMAITVIGGLIISTLLTLVVVPVLYSLMDRKEFN